MHEVRVNAELHAAYLKLKSAGGADELTTGLHIYYWERLDRFTLKVSAVDDGGFRGVGSAPAGYGKQRHVSLRTDKSTKIMRGNQQWIGETFPL